MEKHIAITVFMIVLIFTLAKAQEKIYLDSAKKNCEQSEAVYMHVYQQEGSKAFFEEYLIKGEVLLEKTHIRSLFDDTMYGLSEKYYRNGNLKEIGEYEDDKKVGLWEEYYENGQIKTKYSVRDDTTRYFQCWNTGGDSLLTNGNGLFEYYDERFQRNYIECIRDSLTFSIFYIREDFQDSIYVRVDKRASFEGGLEKVYQDLRESLVYPDEARKIGAEGRVYVQFIVTPSGDLEDVRVLKGIGYGCDEEARGFIEKSSGKWIAGESEGTKVKTSLVLPIIFRLE